MSAHKLDRVDLKILEQLQKDSSISTTELAERIGLSQSPCWRRVQRLKDAGIIKRHVAILDKARLGSMTYIYAYLRMKTLREEERREFIREIELTPEILEAHTIFGDMDILLKVVAPSVEWYQDFIFRKIQTLPGVTDVQSTITLKELKSTTSIPVGNLVDDD